MKSKYYIARDLFGALYLYNKKPIRSGQWFLVTGGSFMALDKSEYPDITWENSPVEVELKEVNRNGK